MSDCTVSQVKIGLSGISSDNLSKLYSLVNQQVVDVIAIMDPSEDYYFAAKTLCLNARRYEQFDHFLSCDLDGVIVATPTKLHFEEVSKCLEKGIPVLCPRSLGRTAMETRSIINSAILSDRLLHVDLSYKFCEEIKMLKYYIANNTIGEIFSIDATFHTGVPPEYSWWSEKELSGGGCLLHSGTLLIDQILWLFNYPEVRNPIGKLYRNGTCINHKDSVVEDFAIVQFEFENDCLIQLKCSWDCFVGKAEEFVITIIGTHGGYRIQNVDGDMHNFSVERFFKTVSIPIQEHSCFKAKNAVTNWIDMLMAGNVRYDPEMEQYVVTKTIIDSIYDNSII